MAALLDLLRDWGGLAAGGAAGAVLLVQRISSTRTELAKDDAERGML